MALHYENLEEVRSRMLEELERDVARGQVYESPRLIQEGKEAWPSLLAEAVRHHSDQWLADELRGQHLIATQERRSKPSGGFTMASVPVTAPDTLAEGEFNRLYIRGVCLEAIARGNDQVEVYRAKYVENARSASVAKIGQKVSASILLEDIRTSTGVDTALGLPPGPNSGLSIKLV